LALAIAATTWLAPAAPADAHLASGSFRLDSQQEVPPPVDAEIADGSAILGLAQVPTPGGGMTFSLTYDITVQNLTGIPTAAHIHAGVAGTAGPVVFPLTFTSATRGAGTLAGEITGLDFADVEDVLGERWYVNVHTARNPQGEVRGQLRIVGVCQCGGVTNADRRTLKRCVKDQLRENFYTGKALKQLVPDRTARRAVATLVKRVNTIGSKSACGPTKPSFTATCCLPVDALGLVAGPPCAPVKKAPQCAKLGGTFLADTTCTVTANPCRVLP